MLPRAILNKFWFPIIDTHSTEVHPLRLKLKFDL